MIFQRSTDDAVFIVTDVECDGPTPGANSMLAFASVAVDLAGEEKGVFEAVLAPLEDAAPDPETRAWFEGQPEAWAAATQNPAPPSKVMADYAAWVNSFPGARLFTAFPLAFDGGWIDHYLRRFTPYALVQGHYVIDRLFDGPGLCLKSFAAGRTGLPPWDCTPARLPSAWFGPHRHTHRAIDDARGYAHLLGVMMGEPALTGRPENLAGQGPP